MVDLRRYRPGGAAGDAQAGRLHRGRARAAVPAARRRGHRHVRRPGHTPPVPRLDHGLDGERRGAKKALAEVWNAEDKPHALAAALAFEAAYGAKFPKATAKITDDLDQMPAFYGYPAEHWVHLRTTNPMESTFATVRHRSKVTKGPGSRAAGPAMAFKLIESAQDRWSAVNAPPPRRPGPRRIDLHQREAHQATRREYRAGSRIRDLDPEILIIAQLSTLTGTNQE